MVWPELLRLNREYTLGGIVNLSKLSLTFPNGHVIYCSGAKDKTEIEKFRGLALSLVYIDEAQSFRSFIKELIEDVLFKALFDYNGVLCVIGTPGPVQAGFYWDITNGKLASRWSQHHWTMLQNPHLEKKSGKKPMALILEDCAQMGVEPDHPKVLRECFGRWAVDTETLVFKYNPELNDFKERKMDATWKYVLGIDVGFQDADAIAVLGWREFDRTLYLVEELVTAKQGITPLADQIQKLMTTYNPDSIVIDAGGLGKKIAEELQTRHSIPVKAAEKHRKFEYIELLNDAMRTGRFLAKRDTRFAEDCALVEWDKDKANPERLVVSDRYHSDICDAVLYAFREAFHWLEGDAPKKLKPHSQEWYDEEDRRMEDAALQAFEENKQFQSAGDELEEWI